MKHAWKWLGEAPSILKSIEEPMANLCTSPQPMISLLIKFAEHIKVHGSSTSMSSWSNFLEILYDITMLKPWMSTRSYPFLLQHEEPVKLAQSQLSIATWRISQICSVWTLNQIYQVLSIKESLLDLGNRPKFTRRSPKRIESKRQLKEREGRQ